MAVDLTKFTKGRSFKPADFNFNDATDLIEIKTDATSAVGNAISAAVASGGVAGATAAETIAGTVTNKYIAPDDLKATLQSGANYALNTVYSGSTNVMDTWNAAAAFKSTTAAGSLNSAVFASGVAGSSTATHVGRFEMVSGTSVGVNGAAVGSAVGSAVATPVGTRSTSVLAAHSGTGAGDKAAVRGDATGAGGTNYGVYGTATGGAVNYAGYFDQGDVLIQKTLNVNNRIVIRDGALPSAADFYKTGSGPILYFLCNGAIVGNVGVTPTATTYNSTSDYRLKNVDGPLTGSGAFIDALKPKVGEWKAELGKKAAFFIAHEVAEVSPTSVQGEKDEVDADGKPKMQSVAYGSAEFIVNIVAELQDLRKRVAALEAK